MRTRRVGRCMKKIEMLMKQDEIEEDSLLFENWNKFKKEFHKQYKRKEKK